MPRLPVVCIVDDDESVRESLTGLLRSNGYDARPFGSAEEFLANLDALATDCAILDVTMPGLSGADLQEKLLSRGSPLPLVFITARTESGLHRRLLERGALACLVKPFHEDELIGAVNAAIDVKRRQGEKGAP
ncbi:MAG TPA: response regulator [Polyangiaceae bacterium]|nr:response regulator [Polyangiaceae bacterium]